METAAKAAVKEEEENDDGLKREDHDD